jgi:baculoviral IAP repeat-containing protein 7/8
MEDQCDNILKNCGLNRVLISNQPKRILIDTSHDTFASQTKGNSSDNEYTEKNYSERKVSPGNHKNEENCIQFRQFNLNFEVNRLETFKTWNENIPISKEKLARLGFYFTNDKDIVKCYFCEVEIGQWSLGDDEHYEHTKWSPYCPLLIHPDLTNNKPFNRDLLNIECKPSLMKKIDKTPINFDYSIEQNRLKSFSKDWPSSLRQTPEKLSEAGFYFFGEFDKCKCFSCGGGLKDWNDDDDPWEQHTLFFSNCQFVNLIKGKDYIEKIKQKHNQTSSRENFINFEYHPELMTVNTSSNYDHQNEVKSTNQSKIIKNTVIMCKICYANNLSIVLIPCMHIVACDKCCLAIVACPICRKKIQDFCTVYFS